MNWRIPLADLDYGVEEENAVLEVLRSKWLTMGEVTLQFEKAFAQAHHAKHAIAVSNATEALHLACLALEIGPGDEVICPSLSFVATSNAVVYTGAKVVFADICSLQDLTIDPEDIERKITPRTKAIIVMHYGGYLCKMAEIMSIAQKHGLGIIEDDAHAPGAMLNDTYAGSWGDIGCFSFFSNKNISTGEGGMLLTNRDDLAQKLRLKRSHGMTSLTYDRHKGHSYSYDVVDLGFNYRIDEIHSALGLAQLRKLGQNHTWRKAFTELYWKLLGDSQLDLPFEIGQRGESAHHIMPVILPAGADRKSIMDGMRSAGIQTSIHYPPTHLFTYYQNTFGNVTLPITETAARQELTLPLYPTMGEDAVKIVAESLLRLL